MNIIFLCIKQHIAATVHDHINAFQQYSHHNICYFDVAKQQITLAELNKFDVIVIHYTVSLFSEYRCPTLLKIMLRHARAKKIVFIQDEYRVVNEIHDNLAYLKIDVLFTCVPDSEIEKVYPTSKLPGLKKINTLTGFVPENLLNRPIIAYKDRAVDVIYRARKLSAWYGELGREKWLISERFSHDAAKYHLKTDLSYREEDRIYGDDWINFLQHAKAALGCESGASVFDFTGDIQRNVELYEQTNPNASFEEISNKFFAHLEGKITLNQISPRCFECAALGTLMILYEGHYSGILQPWQHYIPLKKDHSNMNEVVEYLSNVHKCQEIVDRTYREIALNERYSYKKFIHDFDAHLDDLLSSTLSNSVKPIAVEPAHENITFKLINNGSEPSSSKHSAKYYIKFLIKNIVLMVLKLLPIGYAIKYKKKLICVKNQMMLSISYMKQLWVAKDYSLAIFILNKNFRVDYGFVESIIHYVESVKNALNFTPLTVTTSDMNSATITIASYPQQNHEINWPLANKVQHITKNVEDLLGIPQNIRGKQHVLKYNKLIKYMTGY